MTVTTVQGDWADFHTRALERVSTVPGVQQAAFAWGVAAHRQQLAGEASKSRDGRSRRPAIECRCRMRSVTPGYFSTTGADGHRGPRLPFERRAQCAAASPSSISRSSTVLRPVRTRSARSSGFGDASSRRRDHRRRRQRPHRRSHPRGRAGGLFVALAVIRVFEGSGRPGRLADPRSVIAAVRGELRGVDPTVAIEKVRTLDQIRADSLASRSFAMPAARRVLTGGTAC